MVQDPNVERMIGEAIAPLTKEIKELKRQIETLRQVNEFAIPDVIVNEVAVKLRSFLQSQKNCSPEILEAVNKEFWDLI